MLGDKLLHHPSFVTAARFHTTYSTKPTRRFSSQDQRSIGLVRATTGQIMLMVTSCEDPPPRYLKQLDVT